MSAGVVQAERPGFSVITGSGDFRDKKRAWYSLVKRCQDCSVALCESETPEDRSWKIDEQFFHLCAGQRCCGATDFKDRQTGDCAGRLKAFQCRTPDGLQHDMASLDFHSHFRAGGKTQASPHRGWQNDLAFTGNDGFHGKPILL